MKFTYLKDTERNFEAVWAWAKRLITDLNQDSIVGSSGAGAAGLVPTGALMIWSLASPPSGWLICDGRTISRYEYPLLAAALGYTSGDNFNLPDFRNKLIIGAGSLVALGAEGGSDVLELTADNLPEHTHDIDDPGHSHLLADPGHTHTITDPGHTHTQGSVSSATVAGGAVSKSVDAASTGSAVTGITVNSASTGVTIADAMTGITTKPAGTGEPVSILPPVIGQHIIIKV